MNRELSYSFAGHCIFILLLIIYQSVMNKCSFFSREEKMIPLEAVMRVDVVGLPKHTLKEWQNRLLPPPAKTEYKANNKASDGEKIEETAQKNEDSFLLEKLLKKSLSQRKKGKLDKKIQDDDDSNKENTDSSIKNLKTDLEGLIIAGNQLGAGTSLLGKQGTVDHPLLMHYIETVVSRVRFHWALPAQLARERYQCRIRLLINSSGHLIGMELVESSGHDLFDQKAKEAITESLPFAPPPAAYGELVAKGFIILGFPL
jgi:TonB family protein